MSTHRRVRIFLAEDHQPDARLFEEALRFGGIDFELERAADGEAALNRLNAYRLSGRPDVIVLDLNLPKVDGMAVLSAVHAAPALRGVPVAILTSSRQPADKERAARAGAAAYISKPPDLEDFFRIVVETINRLLEEKTEPEATAIYSMPAKPRLSHRGQPSYVHKRALRNRKSVPCSRRQALLLLSRQRKVER